MWPLFHMALGQVLPSACEIVGSLRREQIFRLPKATARAVRARGVISAVQECPRSDLDGAIGLQTEKKSVLRLLRISLVLLVEAVLSTHPT